jgi:hypothetical protein
MALESHACGLTGIFRLQTLAYQECGMGLGIASHILRIRSFPVHDYEDQQHISWQQRLGTLFCAELFGR